MLRTKTDVPMQDIASFCQRWHVKELALFGSILRDDFGPDSDVDVLVTFGEGSHPSLFDHVTMQDELAELLGRRVDLVSKHGVERSANVRRKEEIIKSAEVIYAA